MKSELDLFAVPPTQVNVETGHWIEHKPLSAIDGDQITVTFTVSGSGDDYIDLHHTILLVKAQIVKTDWRRRRGPRPRQQLDAFHVFRRQIVSERQTGYGH